MGPYTISDSLFRAFAPDLSLLVPLGQSICIMQRMSRGQITSYFLLFRTFAISLFSNAFARHTNVLTERTILIYSDTDWRNWKEGQNNYSF